MRNVSEVRKARKTHDENNQRLNEMKPKISSYPVQIKPEFYWISVYIECLELNRLTSAVIFLYQASKTASTKTSPGFY